MWETSKVAPSLTTYNTSYGNSKKIINGQKDTAHDNWIKVLDTMHLEDTVKLSKPCTPLD